MKLKTAKDIQKVTDLTVWWLMLPFSLCGLVLTWLTKPLEWVVDGFCLLRHRIANGLLRMSDEVKGGTIKNDYCIRSFSALDAWKMLEEERRELNG